MADVGAISSWVAAGISLGALAVTTGRAWWSRPQVDWSLSGKLGWPHYEQTGFHWLEGSAAFSNFGDGPAHRVSVHIQRDGRTPQILATAPLVLPGSAVEFTAGCIAAHLETTHVWVTWTPPPIRRRREVKSQVLRLRDHVTLTDNAERRLTKFREEQQAAAMESDAAEPESD
jgi:hypothetical protein